MELMPIFVHISLKVYSPNKSKADGRQKANLWEAHCAIKCPFGPTRAWYKQVSGLIDEGQNLSYMTAETSEQICGARSWN
jgi:hypothetical protein